jgi:RHS repeat-associated protein
VSDHQSTTRALVDATGSITDTFGYLPYGEVNQRSGNTQTAFQYTGEPQAAGGLTYLRARFVDPRQGRFLGMDAFEGRMNDPMSLHRYIYAHLDPVRNIDPSGLATLFDVVIANHVGTILRFSSAKAARSGIKSILFGHPPKDLGVLGEMILNVMVKSFTSNKLKGVTAQEFGRRVHKDVKDWCERFTSFKGVELKCEPFFISSGAMLSTNPKGSVGVDIVLMYLKTPLVGIELKTGKGMSSTGFPSSTATDDK